MSRTLKELLFILLNKDPQERVGEGQNASDISSLRNHRWFYDLNWDDIIERKLTPPFVPHLKNSLDLSNFDPAFVKIPFNQVNPYDDPAVLENTNLNLKEFDFAGAVASVTKPAIANF